MQRFPRPALNAAFAAFAFAAPTFAQDTLHDAGAFGQLEEAAARLAAALDAYELQDRNGGLVDISEFIHIDKLVFPAGSEPKGWGVEEAPPPLMDATEGQDRAATEPVRRRFRERVIEMASQQGPFRYEQVRELRAVIYDAQLDLAMAELARHAGPAGWPIHTQKAVVDAFATRVRFEVDHSDERQASDAENLIAEFHRSLDGDLERMRKHRQSAGLEQSRLLVVEFRMNVERTRFRQASRTNQAGAPESDKPWRVYNYAGLVLERQRLARKVKTFE